MSRNGARGNRSEQIPGPALARLRTRREQMGISVRGLADRIGVSPRLVSQIETGKVNPSVGTLVAITTELELSLDVLFADAAASPRAPGENGMVLHPDERPELQLETGVVWYRLTPRHEEDVDFLYVIYEVGSESCAVDAMMVHRGREYGLVLSGKLGATIGFDSYELKAGDSIVFEARSPHRFWTIGDEPAVVIWTIIGRAGEARQTFD
ncbi:MAG: cupin domain-containing protein [Actinobacteria bacterium]|nr:cupin domain-containing protein [Actinomycetota bacterium]